jgi:glycosyltransferase involved in cell wall biosynthesis
MTPAQISSTRVRTPASADGRVPSVRIGVDGRAFGASAHGIRRYVSELYAAIRDLDWGTELVAIGGSRESPLPDGLRWRKEYPSLPTNLGRHLTGLPAGIQTAGLDLFHAPAYTAPLWGSIPTVLTIHDVSYARYPAWYPYRRDPARRWFYRRSACRAAMIITDSEFSRQEIMAAYGIEDIRIAVAPLGVSSSFSPLSEVVEDRAPGPVPAPYLLHVGDLHPRRNLIVALRAVLALRVRHPGLRLVLAGADLGSASELALAAQSAGEADALRFLGRVPDQVLVDLYRGAQALVYPSKYEGFGLPLLEAMACGTPVVAARAGAIPEVTGSAAILVHPDDWRGVAEALHAILTSAPRAAALAKAGLERAAAFTWRRTAEQTVEVFRACIRQTFPSSS